MTSKVPARYRNLARWLEYVNRTKRQYRRARTEEMTCKPFAARYEVHISPRVSLVFHSDQIVHFLLAEMGLVR